MQTICGISGNFKLALQVSLAIHQASSQGFSTGSENAKHSCGLCTNQNTEIIRIKREPTAADEGLFSETEVIIKQEPFASDTDEADEPNRSTTNVENDRQEESIGDQPNAFCTRICNQPSTGGLVTNSSTKGLLVPGVEEPYSCGICNQSFKVPANLRKHFYRHREKKIYQCTLCRKQFTNMANLNQHLLIHSGEKGFKCDLCPSAYFRSAELARHKKIHTGEQDYACRICSARFTWSHSLKRHYRRHTGEKPYSCSVCGKTFKEYGTIRRHKRIHIGERSYKCDTCGQNFQHQRLLTEHSCSGQEVSRTSNDVINNVTEAVNNATATLVDSVMGSASSGNP